VNPLPRHLASAAPTSRFFFLATHIVLTPVHFVLAPPPPLLQLSPAMAPPQLIIVLDPSSWPRSTVTPFALNELVNGGLLAPNVEGRSPVWIVPPPTDRETNPLVTSSASSGSTSEASPHRQAASCGGYATTTGWSSIPQRDIAGGNLRRHLRGVLGDPSELGPLNPLVPCGAAHPCHGRDAGASGDACRQPDVRAAGLAQRVVPAVHDDIQQRRVGEGVVLP
jgi:hypothetical protein